MAVELAVASIEPRDPLQNSEGFLDDAGRMPVFR
jgi:hypothetical protein